MYTVQLREELRNNLASRYELTPLATLEDIPDFAVNEYILVDEEGVSSTDLYQFCNSHFDHQIIYIADSPSTTLQSMASTLKILILPAKELLAYLDKNHGSPAMQPILTFWGVLPGLGTTTMALALADVLTIQYGLSVGVLGLNLYDPGSWITPHASHYLDDIQTLLPLRQLTSQKLKSNMYTLPSGASYLMGHRTQIDALEKYTIRDISYLIHQAQTVFDLVILDAGSILNTPAALQALLSASTIFTVITDRQYIDDQFHQCYQTVLKPLNVPLENIFLVGNKMHNASFSILSQYAKNMNVTPLATMKNDQVPAYFAESSDEPIKSFTQEKDMKKALASMAELLASRYDFQPAAATRR